MERFVKPHSKALKSKTNWLNQRPNWFHLWIVTSLGFLLMTAIVVYQTIILDTQAELIGWLLKRVIDLGGFNGRV
jgi:hypothetical protein